MTGWMRPIETGMAVRGCGECIPHCRPVWLAVLCFSVCLGSPLSGQETDLFNRLSEQGLRFTDEVRVRLPPPALKPETPHQMRQAVLDQLAGKSSWERFSRDSVTAPVTIEIDPVVNDAGERLGLLVHNAFVVHAGLSQLKDARAMEEIFGSPADAQQATGVITRELTAEQLRELDFISQAESSASFAYVELPLLNKVLVRGVVRVEKRERPGAIEFVWQLDPSFNRSAQLASRWTRLERNAVGKLVQGDSFPYEGCGGFLGAYEIGDAAQPLLIESRLLLHEPQQWFAGSHFLRSKIPSLIQENARSFRRKLSER